jgi:aspartate kinase
MTVKKADALKVAKFGGTSVADAAQIQRICNIITMDPDRRIVVVSAPGKRNASDTKVTDMLIACAEARLSGKAAEAEMKAVVQRFAEIQEAAGVDRTVIREIEKDLKVRLASDLSHRGRFMDLMKAAGEDNSAKLVAAIFRKNGVDAHYVNPCEAGLLMSEDYGNAMVLPESYGKLAALRSAPGVTVFPGFFGITKSNAVATFPRGGSDITGAILAAAVKADLYENFTDVDSVFAADPRIVPEASPIALLTYREMRELAYAGFGVFHDEAIIPAVQAKIPICVKNTNRPEAPGTRIVPTRKYEGGAVVGVASADGFCAVYVDKYMMNREVGFGRRLLQIMEDEGISYEHAPSGIDNISVVFREKDFTKEKEERVLERIRNELVPDNIDLDRGLALVMIVGEGMHYTVGVAARATTAMANAGVNIEMQNQGSSEISMMFGIKAMDRKKAVQALYAAFFAPPSK